ncbi:hypothetical protein C4K05_0850 [Pseudomonas chlororaphis subsp. aureofaciens]|nr:hypothetical protein C4K08_0825 [Pseudomonas chlororaphis subsp. aureofaciens]AZE33878.1 hypothetical protein C4K06_0823 [Pseudomonas chlororaphis subsp. aureofaciens]AZE40212.1 hypothetical protein C4K05_0850 [Pseudomonas chlororaphis subsp. aureofaciens]
MAKLFDMALFLSGVLTGSKSNQQWHVRRFLANHLKDCSEVTRYYYQLTALLI